MSQNVRLPREFPTRWAEAWGDDPYGIWCQLNGLRFRFIEMAENQRRKDVPKGFWISPPVDGLNEVTRHLEEDAESLPKGLVDLFHIATKDELSRGEAYLAQFKGSLVPANQEANGKIHVVFPDAVFK